MIKVLLTVSMLLLFTMTSTRDADARASTMLCPADDEWTRLSDIKSQSQSGQGQNSQSAYPMAIAQSWQSSQILFAGGSGGLYSSDSCGKSWSPVQSAWRPNAGVVAVPAIATDPSGRVYIGFGTNLAGADRVSDDGGQTWRTSPVVSRFLAASPSSPGTAYGVVYRGSNAGYSAGGHTADAGVTWEVWDAIAEDPHSGSQRYLPLGGIAVDPYDANTVYTVSSGIIFQSIDGGHYFRPHIQSASAVGLLALSIDGSRWWIAGPNAALFTSTDDGQTWTPISVPEPIEFRRLVASPHDSSVIFAVTDRGAYAYRLPSGHAETP